MINIIDVHIHYDDNKQITAVDVKFKSRPEEEINQNNQNLIARISAAFNSLDFFSKYGKTFKMEPNPKRQNVVNLQMKLWENQLTSKDIGTFIDSLQKKLEGSPF